MMALATRYDVSAQAASSVLTERLPAMCGSDTFTTVVSSTSMKVANMTATATIHGFTWGWGSTADGILSLYSMMPQESPMMHRIGGLPALPPPDILNIHPIPHFKTGETMAVKVGINGFGRIGRNVVRAGLHNNDI